MEINIDVEELFLILTPFCQLLHVVSLLVIASELVLPTDEQEDRFDINFLQGASTYYVTSILAISTPTQVKEISNVISNPYLPFNCQTYDYDWIILKLNCPLEMGTNVQPACLPSSNFLPITSTIDRCFVSGWGDLSSGMFTEIFNTNLQMI